MRDHIDLFEEENGSISVEIDLEHYLPLFLRANGQGEPLHADENIAFDKIYADFTNHFAGVGAEALMDDIKTYLLQKYSIEEQAEITASPAFNLIYDGYTEICKNAIDAFLEQHMQNTNEHSHTVKLNINLKKFSNQVSISFSDSGPGFTQPMRDALSTEEKQLAYSEKRQGSQKRAGGTASFKGMMGQGGRGLRNIIALVLSGEPLQPRQKLLRAKHFDSEIHFTNDNNPYCTGACIEITTQIAPIPELNNIKGIEGSPRTASSRPDTTDSERSYSSISTYHSEQSSTHKASAGLSGLSLIIEDSTNEHFVGNSPAVPKSTHGLGLELSIDVDPYDTSHFKGSSPDLPKKAHSSGLSIAGHTDTRSNSGSLPETTQKKSHASSSIESTSSMSGRQSQRFVTKSPVMPRKQSKWTFSSGSTADTQKFARKKTLSASHNTAQYLGEPLAPPLDVRQSWPKHAEIKSTSKKQSEFKGKMQANLGQKKAPEHGKSKKSYSKKM